MRSRCSRNSPMRRRLNMHGATRDFSRMSREDRNHHDALQPVQRFFRGDADTLHLAQRAAQRSALRVSFFGKLQRNTAALAMIRLGEIDQFEVESKGAREGVGLFDGERMDIGERGFEECIRFCRIVPCSALRGAGWRSDGSLLLRGRDRLRPARAELRRAACPESAHRGAEEPPSDRPYGLPVQRGVGPVFGLPKRRHT